MIRKVSLALSALLCVATSVSCGDAAKTITPLAPTGANMGLTGTQTPPNQPVITFTGGSTITVGQSFTVQASISARSGTVAPTGTVTIYVLYQGCGCGAPVATVSLTSRVGNSSSGTVTIPFYVDVNMVGTQSYQAQYNGDANFQVSVSNTVTATLTKGQPTIVFTTPSTAPAFQTLSIPIAVTSPIGPQVPLVVTDNGQALGVSFVGNNGNTYNFVANIPATSMSPSVGHSLGASLAPSTYLNSAFANGGSFQTLRATPTATVSIGAAVNAAQPLPIAVTVLGASNVTVPPIGFVTIVGSGLGPVGGCSLQPSGHNGTCTFNLLALQQPQFIGTHSYFATFSGDQNYVNATSNTANGTITPVPTSMTLAVPATGVVGATNVTATATLTAPFGPQALLQLMDGSTPVASYSPTQAANGKYVYTFALPSNVMNVLGAHTLTVVYAGDLRQGGSSSPATPFTVTSAPSSATLTFTNAGGNAIQTNGSFTFKAAVSGGVFGATGTVDIWMGGVNTGTKVLSGLALSSGVATGTLAGNAFAAMMPNNSYVAVYSGDSRNTPATSAALAGSVGVASTSTVVSVSASTSLYAGGVNVTATLNSPFSPTGVMTFADGAATLGSPSVATPLGGGTYRYTYVTTPQQLATVGTHSITASYAGDALQGASVSAALAIVVSTASSTATLAFTNVGGNTIPVSGSFAFGVTVNGVTTATAPPTGAVSIWLGGVGTGTKVAGPIALSASGRNGVASASLAGNAFAQMAPSNTYTVVYGGDASYAPSTSAAITGIVNLPRADVTPPVVTPVVTGTLGTNGWYTSDVTLTWTVVDPESPITNKSECHSLATIDRVFTYQCRATSAGGSTTQNFSIKRDATPPVLTVAANAGVYSIDQSVLIKCTATDATSGVASVTGCPVGEGFKFPIGANSARVVATDNAGNTASATVPFTMTISAASLCSLTRRGIPQADGNALCALLTAGKYAQYRAQLPLSPMTPARVVVLQRLVDSLMALP